MPWWQSEMYAEGMRQELSGEEQEDEWGDRKEVDVTNNLGMMGIKVKQV